MASVGAGFTRITIDAARLAAFVGSPGGPVMRDLDRRATNLQTAAKAQVGKVTGKLAASIVKRPGVDARGPYVIVGAYTDYALYHHQGTPPHTIYPRTRKVLRFPASGRIVFAAVVHHPGTAPNRYFTDNFGVVGR